MLVAERHQAVDVEAAVRAWARDVLDVKVFFGVNQEADFPQVIIRRVGGADDRALIQFDCWADTKADAAAAAAQLCTELTGVGTVDYEGVRLHDALWLGTRWLPDEASDTPRYIVEAQFAASQGPPVPEES